MIRIGAHQSISNGYADAVKSVNDMGGNCLQMFSSSPRSWNFPEIGDGAIDKFKKNKERYGVSPVYFHASYLINLGDSGRVGSFSKNNLISELNIASEVGIEGSVVHVGTFKDRSLRPAYEHENYPILINNIKEVLKSVPEDVFFIIENSGTRKVGKTIEEIEYIINDVNDDRLRVCLDTCHLHAAGIDITSEEKLDELLSNFDAMIGIDRLELWHLNDSKDNFESFRDRHDNIGEGKIGLEAFQWIINNPKIVEKPFIIETPGFDQGGPDKKNIDILKKLIK